MTSKEALERYYSNLLYGNGGFQTYQEELEGLKVIKQELEYLEELKKMVYTNQLENTKDIENEFGRALTIFQNHCVVMQDTIYASNVLVRLNKENEKLKQIIRENFWIFNNNEVLFKFNEHTPVMQEEIKEVLGNDK